MQLYSDLCLCFYVCVSLYFSLSLSVPHFNLSQGLLHNLDGDIPINQATDSLVFQDLRAFI